MIPPIRLGVLAACTLVLACRGEAPRRHEVRIEGFAFLPSAIQVSVGDTIVWTNADMVPHTATDSISGWDSGSLATDAHWAFVPSVAGEMNYICAYHPSMVGRIVVR